VLTPDTVQQTQKGQRIGLWGECALRYRSPREEKREPRLTCFTTGFGTGVSKLLSEENPELSMALTHNST
jgi:hypothetical protein